MAETIKSALEKAVASADRETAIERRNAIIARMAAQGHTNREIALEAGCSEDVVGRVVGRRGGRV